jgi:hypothetical protein
VYCAVCAEHPEANDLEEFRVRVTGKRDAFAFWYGLVGTFLGGLFAFTFAVIAIFDLTGTGGKGPFTGQGAALLGAAIYSAFLTVLEGAYFFGVARVRVPVALLPPPTLAFYMIMMGAEAKKGPEFIAMMMGGVLAYLLLPLGIGIASLRSPRNKLFFRLPISKETLRALAESMRNRYAHAGLISSLVGFLVPGLSLVAVGLCIMGLVNVDSKARPPVGGLVRAIVGLAIGLFATFVWIVWAVMFFVGLAMS